MKKLLTKIAMIALLPVAVLGKTPPKIDYDRFPEELLVFKMPKEEKRRWEHYLGLVSQPMSTLVMIPEDQASNPKETLLITFCGYEHFPKFTIEEIFERCHEQLIKEYPGLKTSIKTIRKSEKDLLIECTVFFSEKEDIRYQTLARYHLTSKGFHCIAYTSKKFSSEARKHWLEALQTQCSIQSKKKAKRLASKTVSLFFLNRK